MEGRPPVRSPYDRILGIEEELGHRGWDHAPKETNREIPNQARTSAYSFNLNLKKGLEHGKE